MGPIPPKGSMIFAGKFFLLTSSDVKQKYTSRNDSEGNYYLFIFMCFNTVISAYMK
jgi:hypothetical protein